MKKLVLLIPLILLVAGCVFQIPDVSGTWKGQLRWDDGDTTDFTLVIHQDEDMPWKIGGTFNGLPMEGNVNEFGHIEMKFNYPGLVYKLKLAGSVSGDSMSGDFYLEITTSGDQHMGTWSASRE